jgi:Flp pilus assembly CpaE family ATPase
LIRGLAELREAEVAAPVWVVLNRVRAGVVPGDPPRELRAALERFAGRTPAALLPYDRRGTDAAMAGGRLLSEAAPSSPLRAAFAELAGAVAGIGQPVSPRRRHR